MFLLNEIWLNEMYHICLSYHVDEELLNLFEQYLKTSFLLSEKNITQLVSEVRQARDIIGKTSLMCFFTLTRNIVR